MIKTKLIQKSVYFKPDQVETVQKIADRLGMNFSNVVILAINAGLDALNYATNPDWKQFFEAVLKNEGKNEGKNEISSSN